MKQVRIFVTVMNCPKCKLQNLPGSNFCEKCGTDLKKAALQASQPTPVTPYGNYSSAPPRSYSPPARPTPAPRPVPAPRPTPSQASPQPSPPQRPPVPQEPRRSPVRSAAPSPAKKSVPKKPISEPLAYARLIDAQGREFPLRYDDSLVGRASPGEGINPAVDLTAVDQTGTVSRRHARIGKDDSSIFVEELGSSNGSRHNGQALRVGMQTPLADGDTLVFGDLQFTFSLTS